MSSQPDTRPAARFWISAALIGCTPSAPTYWADVQPILEGRCVNCHQQDAIGSMALDSYSSAAIWGDPIAAVTSDRSMPPWPAETGPEYDYDWRLTDDQIATLEAWVEAGAPEGDPDEIGDPLTGVASALSRTDLTLTMPQAYTPSSEAPDDYRCFVIPWTETETQYITGFNVLPGNNEMVHHVAAFLISSDNLLGDSVFEQLDEWESEEGAPGYACFGGPSGPTGDLQLPIQQIAQWVPGNQGLDLPDGTGIEVLPGSEIVLQLHYSIGDNGGETDQTSIEFKLDDNVTNRAVYAPWLSINWPLGALEIPANSEETVEAEGDPRGFFELLNPSINLDNGFMIHSSMLHMHRIGERASIALHKADGDVESLVSIPEWDFDWQLSYQLSEPLRFEEGDSLALECTYNNTQDVDVVWGEGSDDEMCVGNLYISLLD